MLFITKNVGASKAKLYKQKVYIGPREINLVLTIATCYSFDLSVVDAAGKPPSGLMNFKLNWFGDYEECVAVKADDFNGQYCLATFWIVAVQNPVIVN